MRFVVTANAMGEFARTKVVPEVDAIRIAMFAAAAGAKGTAQTFSSADAAYGELLTTEEAIEDFRGILSECILYCSSNFKSLLRKAAPHQFTGGEDPNTNIKRFDEMKIITMPADRFYTAIELFDGKTSGEEAGGYKLSTTGKGINFMLVHPECDDAITEHEKLRYFSQDVNQSNEPTYGSTACSTACQCTRTRQRWSTCPTRRKEDLCGP